MSVIFNKFGFYKVNLEYIKYLYSKDRQVFYDNNSSNYNRKPYLGLITQLGKFTYCLPLTSAKERQLQWKNVTEHNYLIYEFVNFSEIYSSDVYKRISNTDICKKLLAILEIRKMIPVNKDLCEYINFSNEKDIKYKALLEKEYNFLKPFRNDILYKADVLYNKQINTNIIKSCYCNFKLLENAFLSYISK